MTKLDDDQVATYRRDGYLSPLPAIDADRAGELHERYRQFRRARPDVADAVFRSKPHLVFPWLHDLVCDPAITRPVTDLLGPDVLAWGSSFFAKQAASSGYVSWHQDANYWGLEPYEVLTAWIAFTPSTAANGCMRVIPASHSGTALPHRDTFATDNLLSRCRISRK